jgi:hypothetical protein
MIMLQKATIIDKGPPKPERPEDHASEEAKLRHEELVREHKDWHERNKEPVEVHLESIDAREAVDRDPNRYEIKSVVPHKANLSIEDRMTILEQRVTTIEPKKDMPRGQRADLEKRAADAEQEAQRVTADQNSTPEQKMAAQKAAVEARRKVNVAPKEAPDDPYREVGMGQPQYTHAEREARGRPNPDNPVGDHRSDRPNPDAPTAAKDTELPRAAPYQRTPPRAADESGS